VSELAQVLPEAVMTAYAPKVLRGQKALVTGGDSGIGRAICIAMGAAGADVLVDYVDDDSPVEDVVAEVRAVGSQAIAHQADVSNEEHVRSLFRRMFDEFGTIDILVNNAGIQRDAAFEKMTLEQWRQVLDVNLTGSFLCAREAVREFKRRGVVRDVSPCAGKVIFISSVHELIPWARHANYAASKGGMMMLMKSLAQETAPHRIRVNSIAPGAIRTPINEETWSNKDEYSKLVSMIPYGRIGEPEDVARAAVWLASDHSDYVNGITLLVDGGMALYPGFRSGG